MSVGSIFIDARYLQDFLRVASDRGCDTATILEKAAITPGELKTAGNRIDGKRLRRFFQEIERQTNDIGLGFPKTPIKPEVIAINRKLAIPYGTLRANMHEGGQLFSAITHENTNFDNFPHGEKGDLFYWLALNSFHKGANPDLYYWYIMANSYKLSCWQIGVQIKLKKIQFTGPPPPYGNEHHQMFDCDIEYNQAYNCYSFDKNYLDYHCVLSRKELVSNGLVKNYPDWFTIPGSEATLAEQVKNALIQLQQSEERLPKIERVAEHLQMNARALRRRLMAENKNFQQIKADVQRDLAIEKLLADDTPIALIAEQLGFSEPGAFARSFKVWTQYSPSEYRRKHGLKF